MRVLSEKIYGKNHLKKYCSEKCASKAHLKQSRRIVKKCEECGKEYKSSKNIQKCCSLQCAGKRNSRLRLSIPTKMVKKGLQLIKKEVCYLDIIWNKNLIEN